LAVVANGFAGIQVIDVTDPLHPVILGSSLTGNDAYAVVINGDFAFVAVSAGLVSVDLSDPRHPVVRAVIADTGGGYLWHDVAVLGRFAFGAEAWFDNTVPIMDVSAPANPGQVGTLLFGDPRDDHGTGIAVDDKFVYLTADRSLAKNGTVGDSRLYIGQYLATEDAVGIPPTVSITAPAPGDTVMEGQTLTLRAEAADDIAVYTVSFSVNGRGASGTTLTPFEVSFTVPVGVTSLAIGAQALDFGNN